MMLGRALGDADATSTLRTLRARRGLKQVQIARAMDRSQSDVSRIEHAEDLHLSTLRAYVAALGGRLEMVASFPDGRVRISSLEMGRLPAALLPLRRDGSTPESIDG